MYLFFMVIQMIERSERDGGYILSQNFTKVQYYILVSRIRLIISEIITKIQLLRLLKLRQIPYLLIHTLLSLR